MVFPANTNYVNTKLTLNLAITLTLRIISIAHPVAGDAYSLFPQ